MNGSLMANMDRGADRAETRDSSDRRARLARWIGFCAPLGLLGMSGSLAQAETLALVSDQDTRSVVVMEVGAGAAATVLGSVTLPLGSGDPPQFTIVGDPLIVANRSLAFVSLAAIEADNESTGRLFTIDLATEPPQLVGLPILLESPGIDLALSSDGKFILVGGSIDPADPISVVDIENGNVTDTFLQPAIGGGTADTIAIETCSDGSVLATSYQSFQVSRL